MRLLGITDLHDRRASLERLLVDAGAVDVVLLGGDITSFGSPADVEKMVRLAETSGATVLAVAGNCDSAEIEQRLVQLGVSLYQRGVIVEGVGFHGLSGMPPWHRTMYQFTEDELARSLRAGYAQIAGAKQHVVVSHPPPRNERVDRTHWGSHVGSTALRAFVDQTQPALVLCGHIHEGRGIEQLGRTTVVNCGSAAAGSYALIELGDHLKVELRQV